MKVPKVVPDNCSDALVAELMKVWRSSVEATHHFLSTEEIDAIAAYVPEALRGVPELTVAYDDDGHEVAFMGTDGEMLEMLFVAADMCGHGIGAQLLKQGLDAGVCRLDVNEQNPQAHGFYEHMGFEVMGRSELDAQGAPYPILHMEYVE